MDERSGRSLMFNKQSLKRRALKEEKLIKLYKQLRQEINKLENREIPMGKDYNEELEEACNRRLLKLSKRQIQIHCYFVRKGIFVSDTEEPIVLDEKPKLVISSTGVEDLNVLLTEHVNQPSEIFGGKVRIPYRHVTVDDVKALISKVKESNGGFFPTDSSELDQLVQNIACEVNKEVKQFTENKHRSGLDDWAALGPIVETEDIPSTSAQVEDTKEKDERPPNVPSWDVARMELHEACCRGELDCQEMESIGDVYDTEMASTAEEVEDEEEEVGVCESDTESNVSYHVEDDMENADVGVESGDSCCIIEERIHERYQESDDSDCHIIENEEVISNEEKSYGGNRNTGTDLVTNKCPELERNYEELNISGDDDDCCIVEG